MLLSTKCQKMHKISSFFCNILFLCSSTFDAEHLIPRVKPRGTAFSHQLLTLLHSERPKLHRVLAVLNAIGLKHCELNEVVSQ